MKCPQAQYQFELRAVACIDHEEVIPDKQRIMSSRPFGALI